MTRARIFKTAPSAPAPPPKLVLPSLTDSPPAVGMRQSIARPERLRLPAISLTPFALIECAAVRLAKRVGFAVAPESVPAAADGRALRGQPRSAPPAMALRKRIAVLLGIVTVPAMAAPGEFSLFSAPEPAAIAPDPLELAAARALPFERPGMSFPGSAFYFLDDPPAEALIALPTTDPLDSGAEAGRALGEFIRSGPAAKPFFSTGTGLSHSRALDCLAQAVWYEAASESEAGQRAVAQVVLNRVAHPAWPASVCGVVYQGAERSTGCQFTFTCDGSLARRASGATWARAQRIAAEALAGEVYAPVGYATHYHTLWVDPYWTRTLNHVGTIGAHRFYRNRGAGGEKATYAATYAGFEPSVNGRTSVSSPVPESAASAALAPTLAASERRAPKGKAKDKSAAKDKDAPADSGNPEFTAAGEVRPEFANVGKWKADPVLTH
jgi:hypothetical protein